MRVSAAFPSNYLKAADLQGREVNVRIARILMEDIGDDHKPVIYFQGKEKGLVLNKTNANNIALIYGDETDNWINQVITLFSAWVDFQGKSVEAIRVKPLRANSGHQNALPAPLPAVIPQTDPFPQPTAAQKAAAALDGSIPF